MNTIRMMAVLVCVLLAACSVRPRAVVTEVPSAPDRATVPARQETPTAVTTREHTVVRGDTLYGIAFRNGLDHRDLARWNGIREPFTIYPGQRLRLNAPVAGTAQTTRPVTAATPVVSAPPAAATSSPAATAPAATRVPSSAPTTASASTPVVASTPIPPVASASPTPPAPVVSNTPATTPATGPATTPVITTGGSRSVDGITWRWPSAGQVIGRFVAGDPTNQGINIAGSSGQPVLAAADGEVVYSGSGLIGYGELVIIRHSDVYLSAYGHNRKRLVAEGQKVKAGQQIAEMGRSGATRDMLHFEIRKSGKPVDPRPFLPAR